MIKIEVNRIIKYLVLSDMVFWVAMGLIMPIFPIFIIDEIQGGNV